MSRSSQRSQHLPRFPISLPPPSSIPPGQDFYDYVNGKWQRQVHVPQFVSAFGISEEIKEYIDKQNLEILEDCVKISQRVNEGREDFLTRLRRQCGNLSISTLQKTYQANSIKSLESIVHFFDCMRDLEDVGHTLGEMCKYKVPSLFWIYGQYENKKNSRYCLHIGIGRLGLADPSYYHKKAPGKSRTLLLYANLLRDIGKAFGVPTLSNIVPLETVLSEVIEKARYDNDKEYKGSELKAKYAGIPWDAFFESYGLGDWERQIFFVDSESWLRTVEKLFQTLTLENWKLLFTCELLLHYLPYLPPPFDDLHFRFYHHRLRGQAKKTPQKQLLLYIVEDYMAPMMNRLYVESYVPRSVKARVETFVDTLREAAKSRLGSIEWLQQSTRKAAQEKIQAMNQAVAYPDKFATFPLPELRTDNLVENLLLLGEWRTRYEISRLGEKRSDQKDWDDPVFAVNAYYYGQANEIVVPTGSLYWPFYGAKTKRGWNYGGLGVILGHEMTHAFDKDGKDYDPEGYRKSWWSAKDNRAYNKKTRDLVSLYNKQKVLGHPVNGTLTLDENISDLGGLAIALQALQTELEKEKVSAAEKKEAYRQFFISYAVSWRTKEKPAKMLQALFLDRHAPPKLRVNLIVSQFQEWYDAFDIKPSDKMYISPEHRIRIF